MATRTQIRSCSFITLLGVCAIACTGAAYLDPDAVRTRRLDETKDFRINGPFQFTISPNDRWLVFFKLSMPDELATRHLEMANLRILDLKEGTLHKFTLLDDLAPERPTHGDASWAPDSSHCVIPPPLSVKQSPEPGILIDLHDPTNIRIVRTQVKYGEHPAIEVPGEDYKTLSEYTCSDCSSHLNDVDLMRKYIDAEDLSLDDDRTNPNASAAQIVSLDGKKIYFQKGHRTDHTTLYELDSTTGQERELISFKGDCARIKYLRPSPDGTRLAYMVTFGCSFVTVPKLYLLDLRTGDNQLLSSEANCTMHWTSTSNRLYFYRDNYLHVAEFAKSSPSPTATAPAGK